MSKDLENPMRKHILKVLLFKENLTFSQLFQNSFRSSSQFTYHLNQLLKEGLVEKNTQRYKLSFKGKRVANHLSSETIEETKQPLIVIALLLRKGNKVLTSYSKKEPIKDLWGLSCFAKLRFGENVLDCLKKNCSRHLGYELGNKVNFSGIFNIKTKNQGEILLHHQLLVFTSSDFKGKMKEETPTRKKSLGNFKATTSTSAISG
ncbi:MAG: helix-turn-helix domain-containing protein [Nanoarchaeota archaeon]